MSVLDRALSFGRRVQAAATALSSATAASPSVAGLPERYRSQQHDTHPEITRVIRSPEALLGRVSRDAGPGFTRYSTYPADAIDPQQVKAIFRQADLGYPRLQSELYEQLIESDGHLRAVAEARIYGLARNFRVAPRGESELALALADAIASMLAEIENLDDAIESLLWAHGYGYAAGEVVYDFRRVKVGKRDVELLCPHRIEWVHQKHFEFDQVTDEPFLYLNGRVSLPEGKFIFHRAGGPGLTERRGYMRPCTPYLAAKRWAWRDWINFSHLYGVPQLEGIYDGDTEQYDAQRALNEKILRDFGMGIPAIHSRDFEIKITPAPAGGRANDPQGAMIGWINSEISKIVQHETLTTEMGGTGSYNASETHADVKFNVHLADERKLSGTTRRDLLTPFVRFNLEPLANALGATPAAIIAAVPSMRWRIEREMSPEVRARIFMLCANEGGASVSEDQLLAEMGIDRPAAGRPALKGKAVPVGSGGTVGSVEASQDGAEPPPKEAAATDKNAPPAATGEATDAPPTSESAPHEEKHADAAQAEVAKINLTSTDLATIVTVDEARESQGLPPLGGADGKLTVAEFKAKHEAVIAKATDASEGTE